MESSASAFTLVVRNNSANMGSVCLYQAQPAIANVEAWPLAWMVRPSFPSTETTLQWTINYSFVWDQTGRLQPGLTFYPRQQVPTDLSADNQITLTQSPSLTFTSEGNASPGTLVIQVDSTIPPNTAAVGIGMSGAGTFVAQAQPNLPVVFTPHPTYWLTFGTYENGQVLDTPQIQNAVEVLFPPGVLTMYATLGSNGTWSVSSSA